ncbi:hypothetical protein IFT77_09430 [Frigoribacterium sp. CFBP 13729]|uniref:hypothetical protein n=1 Tax=Frigoribacterium sp. CFBP 13729 TaxID=2775293 RepID=UPI00177F8031|nr:hypothetical protein [Frigoribacterium sp. CFBP 13729]MBD8610705.1 hypothetical protein [Frigoribacterium sp. CFBP 13729]
MQWWNSFVEWASSDAGWRIVSGAVVPFVAIVLAGVVAALIGRAAMRRVVAMHDDEAKATAVAGIVSAARKAAIWSSLGPEERAYADHLAQESEVRLRLLPVSGAGTAASWAEHEIAELKRNSASFSYDSGHALDELRDRLIEWQNKPGRAKKLFKADLERWSYEEADVDKGLDARQKAWDAEQAATASREARPTMSAQPAQPAQAAQTGAPAYEQWRSPVSPATRPADEPAPAREAPSETRATAVLTSSPDDDTDVDPDTTSYGQQVSAQDVRRRTSPDA